MVLWWRTRSNSRTCSKCKKVFPVRKGHNARTCGKHKIGNSNPAGFTHDGRQNEKKTQILPTKYTTEIVEKCEVPQHLFQEVIVQIPIGEVAGRKVYVKQKNGLTLGLPKRWSRKYNYIEDVEKKVWFNKKGELHRLDGPALEYSDGRKEWWVNGELHREDGPAVDSPSGGKEWHVGGKLHRLDGPAVETPWGVMEWWVNGEQHRIGGPAVIMPNGNEQWYVEGEFHREDGPAINNIDCKAWYINGKKHRLDGPAVIIEGTTAQWWVNGLNMEESADLPEISEIMGIHFYLLCTNENPKIRRKALANPNCPPAWKVAGNLV